MEIHRKIDHRKAFLMKFLTEFVRKRVEILPIGKIIGPLEIPLGNHKKWLFLLEIP